MTTPDQPVDLTAVLAAVDRPWDPHLVATVNDYAVRVVKTEGAFVWHHHADTDEYFHVLSGELRIDLRDGPDGAEREVVLPAGAVYVIPRGVVHRPRSPEGAEVLVFEPSHTPNTGDDHEPLPGHIETTTGRTPERR